MEQAIVTDFAIFAWTDHVVRKFGDVPDDLSVGMTANRPLVGHPTAQLSPTANDIFKNQVLEGPKTSK
jgi:hypothetical protein